MRCFAVPNLEVPPAVGPEGVTAPLGETPPRLGAFGLLEQGIEKPVHPILRRQDLPARAGITAPGGFDRQQAGISVRTQKGVDAVLIFLGKKGAGGIQELTPGGEEWPEPRAGGTAPRPCARCPTAGAGL